MFDSDKVETSVSVIKTQREHGFPKDVLKKGFHVDTFHSAASVEMDRIRILNAIRRVDAADLDTDDAKEDDPDASSHLV